MAEKISITEARKILHAQAPARKVRRDYKRDFLNQLHLLGLPQPQAEFRFAPPRRWKLDFCYLEPFKIAIEYNGIFGGSGATASHASLGGLRRDYEKLTEASLMGYRIILITAETVRDGRAVEWVRRALEARL